MTVAKLRDSTEEQNWEVLATIDNPESQLDFSENTVVKYLDDVCPVKTFRVRQDTPRWFPPYLLDMITHVGVYYINQTIYTYYTPLSTPFGHGSGHY